MCRHTAPSAHPPIPKEPELGTHKSLPIAYRNIARSPTPFLVAPGEVILGTGEQLSEYRVVMASSTPDEDTTPDVFLVDPEQIGPGATSAPDNDR